MHSQTRTGCYLLVAFLFTSKPLPLIFNLCACVSADCKEATQGDQYIQESARTDETTTAAQTHCADAAVPDSESSGPAGYRG